MENTENEFRPESSLDPLKDYYKEIVDELSQERKEILSHHAIALLVIDIQYLDAARGYGVFKDITSSGIPVEQQKYYFDTLEERVIPNVQKLLNLFRTKKMEIIHTRIQSLTMDGRDRSNGHKRLNLLAPPGSKEAEFLPQVAPKADEIVINKTASGVFSSTNLNFVLQNIGIKELIIAGVYTNECVETTVRDACDLGYLVTMVEDACTTVTPELHQGSINNLKDRYASILSTADIEKRFADLSENHEEQTRHKY
ncbi:MAG: cysteine hydrolase family protein [Cytophagaceae bacterium]